MRLACRQDKILVAFYFIFLSVKLIPSSSFHVVYKDVLGYRLPALPVVVFRFGIITYVRDVQWCHQGMFFHFFDDRMRDN